MPGYIDCVPDPMLFERDPERYRRARPAYPGALWDLLATLGVARSGARVLDVGAGTGQATGPLLARGATVDAIEPGNGLAGLLRQDYPHVSVQNLPAEAASYQPDAYDGVVSATALHWLDLDVVLPRLRDCLRRRGWFVPFWNVFFDPEAEPTAFRNALNSILGGHPSIEGTPLDRTQWTARLGARNLFTVEDVYRWRWTHQMTAATFRDLASTFNGWSGEQIAAAAAQVERLGGSVVEHYTTVAYACRPVCRP